MLGLAETLLFSAVLGFSIFLSLPVVLSKRTTEVRTRLFNSAAIGILIFLVADIFTDAANKIFNGSLLGFGSDPLYDAIFMVFFSMGFLILYLAEDRSKVGLTPHRMALIIALAIGFQNLTEGLLFGSLGARIGLTGATAVVLVGFIFQNLTEGFPITSPFFGVLEKRMGEIVPLLAVGGVPAIIGGAIGHYYTSMAFPVAFDGLAIGAMVYVILPMLRTAFREVDRGKMRTVYLGVFIGFLAGFLVNLI